MENKTYKSDLQEKEKWKKLVTIARFAFCQRCTNCSQHSYTTDFTVDSAKCNQKKRWTILQHRDCWNRKCREWGIKMWVVTVDFMKAFDSVSHQSLWKSLEKCGIESHYICFLWRLYAELKKRVSLNGQRKRHV